MADTKISALTATTTVGDTDEYAVAVAGASKKITGANLKTAFGVAVDALWDTKGDLAAATGANAASKLAAGTNGHVLTADSAQPTGIKWAAIPGGGMVADTLWDAKGDLAVGSAADTGARLAVGTNGNVLTADSAQTLGVKWATPSAGGVTVLNYTEITANVTISATSAATANTIVTASGAVTVNGSTLITVEFYAYSAGVGASSTTNFDLWQDSTDLGVLGAIFTAGASAFEVPILVVRRFTPAAGTYTYSMRGWRTNANATVRANVGGAGFPMPAYIRVTSGS